jgi:solute carrier family 25 carnitine/acylcarnitine transporter 20/29
MEGLSSVENGILGVTTALLEGVLLQPTLYWKNMRQQGLPLSVDPRLIYRGMGAALCNEAGQMAMQFAVTGLLKSYFSCAPSEASEAAEAAPGGASSFVTDMAAAAGGGAIVAVFASPVELVMIQQQRFGGSLVGTPVQIMRAHGAATLFRGLGLAAARDAIYVGGMLGVAPVAQQQLVEGQGMAVLPATLWSSALGGVAGGVLSHPFDVVKTCMQGDLKQETYRGALASAGTLLRSGGARRFLDGCFWRTFNITATVYVANECCVRLPPYLTRLTRGE